VPHWLLETAYCVTSNNIPSHPYDPGNTKIMDNKHTSDIKKINETQSKDILGLLRCPE
jgi:hypothetical protein